MSLIAPINGEPLDLDAVRSVLQQAGDDAQDDHGQPVAKVTRGWLRRVLAELDAARDAGA